jgi:hypothetical protein
MHEREVGPVVDYIYEAAVRPELWRPALDRLASASSALGAQMLYHRPEGAALHTVSSGLKEISDAFFREGRRRCPASNGCRQYIPHSACGWCPP